MMAARVELRRSRFRTKAAGNEVTPLKFFGQKSKCIDSGTEIRRTIGSESEVHAFEMEDGSVAVVGWLKTHIKAKEQPAESGNLTDGRRERIELSLPMTRATRFSAMAWPSPRHQPASSRSKKIALRNARAMVP